MVAILKQGASKRNVREILKTLWQTKSPGIDAYKYCGSISLKKDALAIQKELRNEWE